MQSVNIIMKLFRVMSEEEKRKTVMEIGAVCENEGLIVKWSPTGTAAPTSGTSTTSPPKKRRGNWKPYWMKHITAINPSARGMDKVRGDWINADEIRGLAQNDHILIGVKKDPKEYIVAKVCSSSKGVSFQDAKGNTILIEGLIHVGAYDKWNDAVDALNAL